MFCWQNRQTLQDEVSEIVSNEMTECCVWKRKGAKKSKVKKVKSKAIPVTGRGGL
jgi:hypothetical protein